MAIAVALSNRPPLLLADEPTGELDDATASEVLGLFDTVNRELGTTIIIVTHDPNIAYKVGRVVMIRDGKTSAEIRRKVSFQRVSGEAQSDEPLEEFILVDASGRMQIPKEFLEQLKIKERAKVVLEGDRVTIKPRESRR